MSRPQRPEILVGIERGFLQLGHPHGDGRHFQEVRVAADRLAAVAVIGQQLGFVADANLPHFDARLKFAGELLHQLAKVDAVLGQVVDDNSLAAKHMLDIDQLHRQFEFGHVAAARFELVLLAEFHAAHFAVILGAHHPQDLALRRIVEFREGVVGGLTQNFAHLQAAIRTGHHLLAAAEAIARTGRQHAQRSHDSVTYNVFGHGAGARERGGRNAARRNFKYIRHYRRRNAREVGQRAAFFIAAAAEICALTLAALLFYSPRHMGERYARGRVCIGPLLTNDSQYALACPCAWCCARWRRWCYW